jgi:hypothetical protein
MSQSTEFVVNKRLILTLGGLSGITASAILGAVGWTFVGNDISTYFTQSDPLYSGRTIITGQRDETRNPGFSVALLDVAKKVSGDQTLAPSDIESIVHGNIKLYVKDFTDHDTMEGIPIHDEQGTRDRQFELLINFVPKRVDVLLHNLGRSPWLHSRPSILVLVEIENANGSSYMLTNDEDEERGAEQREAFVASAWEVGIPLILPSPKELQDIHLDSGNIDQLSSDQLRRAKLAARADVVISGKLTWIGGANGWQANWVMETDGTTHRWQIVDINFDGAFRNAMRGAAHILSHHGEPPPNLN